MGREQWESSHHLSLCQYLGAGVRDGITDTWRFCEGVIPDHLNTSINGRSRMCLKLPGLF